MFVVDRKKWKKFIRERGLSKKQTKQIYDMAEKFEKNCRKGKEYE